LQPVSIIRKGVLTWKIHFVFAGEQVPDGTTAASSGRRAEAERVSNKNLVPKQACQNQEGVRPEEPSGAAADGAGSLQPQHHPLGGGERLRHGRRGRLRRLQRRLNPRFNRAAVKN
jgi:hypothetical protein